MDKTALKEEVKVTPVSKRKFLERRFPLFQIIIIISGVLFGVLTYLITVHPAYFPIDLTVTRAIQNINLSWFDFLMKLLTNSGYFLPTNIIIFSFFFLLLAFKKPTAAGVFLLSSWGAGVIAQIIKVIVQRPRPDPLLIIQSSVFTSPDSFPSGHVLVAVGIYGFLFFLTFTLLKRNLLSYCLMALEVLIIILMGISRIYLGAHWLSDVTGSLLIGLIWLYLVSEIYKTLVKKANK